MRKLATVLVVVGAILFVGQSSFGWTLFKPQGGHFQILFPNTPQAAETKLPFRSESEIVTYNNYVAKGRDNTLYLLTVAVYPIVFDAANAHSYLQNFLLQLTQTSRQDRLIRQQLTTFQNNPAIDFALVNRLLCTRGRAILAGDRMFVMLSSHADDAIAERNFRTFANSLVIQDIKNN